MRRPVGHASGRAGSSVVFGTPRWYARGVEPLKVLDLPALARVPAVAARLSAPAGPARPTLLTCAETSVLSLPGRYCVVYIVVSEGRAALVDVGSTEDIPLIERGLQHLGLTSDDVAMVVATHLHFDHVMGLDDAARSFGAPLRLGSRSRVAVETGTPIAWPRRLGFLRAIPGWVMQGAPVLSKSDRARGLAFGFPWGHNRFLSPLGPALQHMQPLPGLPGWIVIDTPGHSSDSICLHHGQSGILVAGDSVRNFRGGEWNPLLDDNRAYDATRKLLMSLPIRAVGPGHGPVLVGEGVLKSLPAVGFFGGRRRAEAL